MKEIFSFCEKNVIHGLGLFRVFFVNLLHTHTIFIQIMKITFNLKYIAILTKLYNLQY